MTAYTMSRDVNGNRTLRVKPKSSRAFTIETNGNLPETHRQGVCEATPSEVSAYVRQFGTERQRQLLGI